MMDSSERFLDLKLVRVIDHGHLGPVNGHSISLISSYNAEPDKAKLTSALFFRTNCCTSRRRSVNHAVMLVSAKFMLGAAHSRSACRIKGNFHRKRVISEPPL
jgi:hypothetical protein